MRTRPTATGIITGVLLLASLGVSAQAGSLSGGILGQVKNSSGVSQMGATVLLYDRYDQLVRRALTTEDGKFAFAELAPNLYSIRVLLASFVPAMRRNISVAAGSENLLQISLANLFSTVDLVSLGPARGLLLSDDWKWVLRSSSATRPILRYVPAPSNSRTTAAMNGSIFSDTTGMLRVSAGDGESFTAGSGENLGTAFAVATSIYGTSRLQFSGNVGYVGSATLPEAGVRTTYSRTTDGDSGPQVTLTIRQLYLPDRSGSESVPALHTMSLAVRDSLQVLDKLRVEYGMSTESVTYLERLSYISPFVRGTYDLGDQGVVRVAYSDGEQPAAFAAPAAAVSPTEDGAGTAALNNDLAALALLPRISRRDGHIQAQRTQNMEAGYERVQGSRQYSVSVYSESASNATLMLSGSNGFVSAADSLPDLGSNDRIFNIGSYNRMGYTAGVKQSLGEHAEVSLGGGYTGALGEDGKAADGSSGDDLRAVIREVARPWMAMSFSGTLPVTGTVFTTSYGMTDPRVLMPDHYYMTQNITQTTGWNVRIRQPLPLFGGIGGRLEATAELRNLLAQGYLPLSAGGQKAILTNCPRAVRGGLAFIF